MAEQAVTAAELRACRLLVEQPEAVLHELAAAATRRFLADREVLVTRGERCTQLAWVVGGRLALSVPHEGRSVLVMTLGPGDLLGWSLLREEPTVLASAHAVGPTELIELPAERLFAALTAGTPAAGVLLRRLIGIAAADLEATRAQLLRLGHEGPISAG